MNLLIIGGAGYIGSHMVKRLLAAKHALTILDDLSTGYRDAVLGGTFIQGDVGNRTLLDNIFSEHKFDAVIHFASYIQVGESVKKPDIYYQNNLTNTQNLLNAMNAAGVKQFIFSSTAAKFGEPNIRVKLISDWPRRNGIFWSLFGQALAALPERLDIFWATNGLAPIFMPCPVCLTIYDFVYRVEPETMKWRARLWRSFSQPRWIKKSNKIFSISDDVAEQTLKYYGRHVDAVIKPATNSFFSRRSITEIEIVRGKYGIESHYGLIVGTLEPWKNVRLFVETFLDFRAGHVTDTVMPQLVVIGGKGWNDKDILRVLGSAEASGSVKRLGYVDQEDLPALYSGVDVFYMPSRYEGFGMPILEARKCGTPVVCSDVPAMKEAGGNFALYHPPTREGIWKALEQVHVRYSLPDSDSGQAVDWSWESGAQQLKILLQTTAQRGQSP